MTVRPGRIVAVLAVVAALVAAARCGAFRGPRPNVLLLVMDTTRADRCSFVDGGRPTTPNLERLARESVVFTDAWSPSCWTMPAHASLFTGRHPEDLGVADGRTRMLRHDVPTLAERLRAEGWSTACFTNNGWISPAAGLTRGFDAVEAFYLSQSGTSAAVAHRRALAWMRARKDAGEPFFAFVNDVEPHAPWDPPAEWTQKFLRPGIPEGTVAQARKHMMSGTGASGASAGLAPELLAAISDLYDAEVAQLDGEIGSLIDAMRADGLLENTIVVILGDHGEGLGDHGWLEHGAFLYRELLRVPLLVRPPGGTPARRVAEVVRLEDVPTTILGTCGVGLAPGEEGRDLLGPSPSRTSFAAEKARKEWLELVRKWASPETLEMVGRKRRSVYDGRHHLIVDDRGNAELYDVAADPAERNDLAASSPDVVARLRALLDAPKR